jgi:2-polyprenyl-3-methyl-5-hydroxy-6-metoxy-1,4-benzoquinol methylase
MSMDRMQPPTDANKLSEIDSAERFRAQVARTGERMKPFGLQWDSAWWLKWVVVHHALRVLGVPAGGSVLELGTGTGWMALLLAEAGLEVVGVDIAPANVELAAAHAARWSSHASFEVGDLEELDLGRRFDAVLAFDALHHLEHPGEAVRRAASHLEPGGIFLAGEPSWLHRVSPHARRVHRDTGWIERGMTVRELKSYCRSAGLEGFRRFYESSRPYDRRGRGFLWEWTRLAAANAWVAPQHSIWLSARKA